MSEEKKYATTVTSSGKGDEWLMIEAEKQELKEVCIPSVFEVVKKKEKRKFSEEHLENLRIARRKRKEPSGWKHTKETKAKVGAAVKAAYAKKKLEMEKKVVEGVDK